MTAASGTDHDDLMDLASRFAYDKKLKPDHRKYGTVLVNGTVFTVLDVHGEPENGLNAITFKNTETQEVVVAFQGSAGEVDWQNNAELTTTATPEQFRAAEEYVKNLDMQVDFVCGNSLGGGLAAEVAGKDQRIQAVTVDPAPVPAEIAGIDAPNVHNYLVENDMLHQLVVAGGLSDRIIGTQTTVPGTTINDVFGANHIGSDRGVSNRGATGEGMGVYDASMATTFSLVHPDRVLARDGFGPRVDVDVEALRMIADGLDAQRRDLGAVVTAELTTTRDDLELYARELPAREQQMREVAMDAAEEQYQQVHERLGELDAIIEQLHAVHRRIRCPGVLGFFWYPIEDMLVAALRDAIEQLDALIGFRIRDAAEQAWECSIAAMETARAISAGLIQQCADLHDDLDVVDRRWGSVVLMTATVASELDRVDTDLAAAIASRTCPADALVALPVLGTHGTVHGVTVPAARTSPRPR